MSGPHLHMTQEQAEARMRFLLAEEAKEPEQTFYLSFAGEDGFRGGVFVVARGMMSAVMKASTLGINPGGEVMGVGLGDKPQVPQPPPEMFDKLLTESDLRALWPDTKSWGEHEAEEAREADLLPERQAIRKALRGNPEGAATLARLIDNGQIIAGDGDPDEPLIVMVVPWAKRSVKGCVKDKCATCDQDVALSPSSQEMVLRAKASVTIKCADCIQKEIKGAKA